jgi:hypothetical protein
MVARFSGEHDGAMNETSYAQRPPHQDLDRLRRSVTDRYVAGVAGGLGRHFGIDPTIIRVLPACSCTPCAGRSSRRTDATAR